MPHAWLDALTGALFLASLAGGAYWFLASRELVRFVRRAPRRPGSPCPVTVLKPLSGAEAGLYESLRSFLETGYGSLQVVFGVRDEGDPAAGVVARLRADLPGADLALVVDGRVHGKNPKVSNLLNMLPEARHDRLLIADSDIRVGAGYVEAVTAPLEDPGTGLVTCLYVGRPDGGLWSRLGALWVNHAFLPSALVADRLGSLAGSFGATLALRRDTLEGVGGLSALADQLADDHALGAAVRRGGLEVVLSEHLVDMVVSEPTASSLLAHELRWLRTIRTVAPWGYAGMVVTHPVALAALALPLAGFSPLAWSLLALAVACRLRLASRADRALRLERAPLWLLALREGLSFGLFLAGFFSTRVAWRGQRFRIEPDGTLAPLGGSRA